MTWEVDWEKRDRINGNVVVWARNPDSRNHAAREWHWTTYQAITRAGVKWEPVREIRGRCIERTGYATRGRGALTDEEIALAEEHDLWIGQKRGRRHRVNEHQLVAVKKYGRLPPGVVVRHRNGRKADNRPENLVLGTRKENAMDHHRAIREMFYWRERALVAEGGSVVEALTE